MDGEFLCEDCRAYGPAFDRVGSAARFESEARDLISAFKFNGKLWLRDDLVDWLEGALRARFRVGEIDVVLPMPSTLFHLWNRGYNQCAALARPLARRIGKPCPRFVMRRTGHPRRQSGLGEAERRRNALGTFRVTRPARVDGLTVLVVDDIMTTGATLSECAAELKRAGAARVWGVTLARSLRTA